MTSPVAKRRELRSQIRERRSEVVPKLRALVKQARGRRKKALSKCRTECQRKRTRAMAAQTKAREQLRERIKSARVVARAACTACKASARGKGLDDIDRALGAVQAEREAIAGLRARAGSLASERGRAGGRRAAELREESDSFVESDLGDDPELVALWRKLKGKIKAGTRRTRTEAFFEFIAEHPEELDQLRAKQEIAWASEAAESLEQWEGRQPIGSMNDGQLAAELAKLDQAGQLAAEVPF